MTMSQKRFSYELAASPVVGVMLMLIVVIIIAAVVSGFAGGMVSGQKKVPQATIQATFSQSNGMTITHAGGDVLPTAALIFTVSANQEFGQGLQAVTTQVLNASILHDSNGNPLKLPDGTSNLTAFRAGDTLFIDRKYLDPQWFQPAVAPCEGLMGPSGHSDISVACSATKPYGNLWYDNGWQFDGNKTAFWNLAFVNPNNVGKTFSFTVADKKGSLISQTDVTISP